MNRQLRLWPKTKKLPDEPIEQEPSTIDPPLLTPSQRKRGLRMLRRARRALDAD